MRHRLTVEDEELGVTAIWTGGMVAILIDDRTGRVISRGAIGELATTAVAVAVMEGLIRDERQSRQRRRRRPSAPGK